MVGEPGGSLCGVVPSFEGRQQHRLVQARQTFELDHDPPRVARPAYAVEAPTLWCPVCGAGAGFDALVILLRRLRSHLEVTSCPQPTPGNVTPCPMPCSSTWTVCSSTPSRSGTPQRLQRFANWVGYGASNSRSICLAATWSTRRSTCVTTPAPKSPSTPCCQCCSTT